MPLPGFLTKIIGSKGGDIISSVANTIDRFVQTKDEKAAITAELTKEINRHLEAITDQSNKELEMYLKDVDSARNMQIEALKQEDKFAKRFIYYLAIGVMSFAFVFDMCLFFIQYPERNHDLVNMVCGTINLAGFGAVISFFFGSSKSSHNKQETIDALKNR